LSLFFNDTFCFVFNPEERIKERIKTNIFAFNGVSPSQKLIYQITISNLITDLGMNNIPFFEW
jgi:hypothetical protein